MHSYVSRFALAKLSEYAAIQPGYAFSSERFTDNPSDIALVKGENVQQGFIDWSASKYWPASDADQHGKYRLELGDVVLAMDRPWVTSGLKWAYIKPSDPECLLVQRVARIRGRKQLDQTYLRCLISSTYFSNYIQPIVTGVNVPHISGKQIGDFKIPVPSINTQKKIAAILSAYDDLIENNRRRIALLEKMAEEIYREWFVRLRFPGHEQAKFEKGLPVGWRESASSDVFEVLSGGTPKTDVASYWDGDIPFFTPKDATESFYVMNTEKNITANGLRTCNSRLYAKDTIFITARGTVGKLALASRDMAMNQSCYALVPKGGGPVYFHYLAIQNAITYLKGISKSGVFDNVVIDTFKTVPIVMPTDELIKKCNQVLEPLFVRAVTLLRANEALVAQRDALLPRLISGKLPVDDLDIRLPASMQLE